MPYAITLSNNNIVEWISSHPEQSDGTAGPNRIFVSKETYDLSKTTPRPQLVNGEVVSGPEPEPSPPQPFSLSKLKIRREMRNMGLEGLLNQFLASDVNILNDWNDAQVLMSDDPMLVEKLPLVTSIFGITEEQLQTLFNKCR